MKQESGETGCDQKGLMPPRLHIELSPKEIGWIWRFKSACIVVIVAQLLLCGWLIMSRHSFETSSIAFEKAAARTVALVKEIDDQLARSGSVFSPDEMARVKEEVALANQLVDKRAFSWTQLLSDLEEAIPTHIALESIKPNFQDETVVLDGVAERLQDIDALVQTLQDHGGFRQAVLVRHEFLGTRSRDALVSAARKRDRDALVDESTVQFSLVAQYRQRL